MVALHIGLGAVRMDTSLETPRFARRSETIHPSGTSMAQIAALSVNLDTSSVIDFTIGELGLSPSERLTRAAVTALENGASRYTDTLGHPALRKILAAEFSEQTGEDWSVDEVALTAGAKPGLFFLGQILLDPGDEVIIPRPHWQTFPTQIRLAGGNPVLVDHDPAGQLNIPAIRAAVTGRTRAIIINTPNNPTGVVYTEEGLRHVAEIALTHNLWIVFDQCYRNFTYGEHVHHNIVKLNPAIRQRTIIIDSFSKRLAIAGWRLGFMAAPQQIIAKIRAYQSHITSCPNVVGQQAVLTYLENGGDEFVDVARRHVGDNRALGLNILSALENIPAAPAQGGFYFYLNVSELLGGYHGKRHLVTVDDVSALLLADARIATVPGTAFSDPQSIRICYSGRSVDLDAGLQRAIATLNAVSRSVS